MDLPTNNSVVDSINTKAHPTKRKAEDIQDAPTAKKMRDFSKDDQEVSSQPFRFLDLPKEVRLMIYERLPITTKMYEWGVNPKYEPITGLSASENRVTFLDKTVPTNILRVCRQISEEALAIMEAKLSEIRTQPPKVVIRVLNDPIESYRKLYRYWLDIYHVLHSVVLSTQSYPDDTDDEGWYIREDEMDHLFQHPFVRRVKEYVRYRQLTAQQPLPSMLEIALVEEREEFSSSHQDSRIEPYTWETLPLSAVSLIPSARRTYYGFAGPKDKKDPLVVVRLVRPSSTGITADYEAAFAGQINRVSSFTVRRIHGRRFQGTVVGNAIDAEEYTDEWCPGERWSESVVSNMVVRASEQRAREHDAKSWLE